MEPNGYEVNNTLSYEEHAYMDALLDSTYIKKKSTQRGQGWWNDDADGTNFADFTDEQIAARRARTNNYPTLCF